MNPEAIETILENTLGAGHAARLLLADNDARTALTDVGWTTQDADAVIEALDLVDELLADAVGRVMLARLLGTQREGRR
jgi:hypothetical protein